MPRTMRPSPNEDRQSAVAIAHRDMIYINRVFRQALLEGRKIDDETANDIRGRTEFILETFIDQEETPSDIALAELRRRLDT